MKNSPSIKAWSLDNDKDYFAGLWRGVKDDWQWSLIVLIGLTCLFTVTLLYLEANAIDAKVWGVSFVIVSTLMLTLLQMRRRRKTRVKKVIQHDFDPVSLGILYFGSALSFLSLVISQQIGSLFILIVVFFFSVSLAFLFAVFSRPVRGFINTRAAPILMALTFTVSVLGFVLGMLPALSQDSPVIRAVIIYFGFAWVVAILVTLFRDVKDELARVLFVIFFVIAAVIRFREHETIGIIGGIFLMGIAVLLYLVATGRLHPYGKVSE